MTTNRLAAETMDKVFGSADDATRMEVQRKRSSAESLRSRMAVRVSPGATPPVAEALVQRYRLGVERVVRLERFGCGDEFVHDGLDTGGLPARSQASIRSR